MILTLLISAINVMQIILIVYVIMGWMAILGWSIMRPGGFGFQVYDSINKLITPILEPIRRVIPNIGPFDMSFMVLFFGLLILRNILELMR